jgi:sugar O-acyltransferase (sialic acid O-acetyltransferase NeuD family)
MDVIVYGAGRAGRIIKEILEFQNKKIIGFIDDDPKLKGTEKYGIEILGDYNYLKLLKNEKQFDMVISIASPDLMKQRDIIYNKLKNEGYNFINIIHPTVYISPSAIIGNNNFISPGAIIEAGTIIGDNNRICVHASIDHDCIIGNSNFIGANAYVASCSKIENRCSVNPCQCLEPFTELK